MTKQKSEKAAKVILASFLTLIFSMIIIFSDFPEIPYIFKLIIQTSLMFNIMFVGILISKSD